jgi:hypothetical protein
MSDAVSQRKWFKMKYEFEVYVSLDFLKSVKKLTDSINKTMSEYKVDKRLHIETKITVMTLNTNRGLRLHIETKITVMTLNTNRGLTMAELEKVRKLLQENLKENIENVRVELKR